MLAIKCRAIDVPFQIRLPTIPNQRFLDCKIRACRNRRPSFFCHNYCIDIQQVKKAPARKQGADHPYYNKNFLTI
jgi:hypothetical protein